MKRQWSILRLFGAAAILAAASLTWYYWPHTPRWQMPAELVLGFDDENGLLISIMSVDEGYKLRSRDLDYGRIVHEVPVTPKPPQPKWSVWSWYFSPNKAHLVACSSCQELVLVFSASTGEQLDPVIDLSPDYRIRGVETIGFSQDGALLILCSGKQIVVWDMAAKKVSHTVHLPIDTFGRPIRHGNFPVADHLQITADHRFLAVTGDMQYAFVYDLQNRAEIGRHRFLALPRFLENQQILFIPLMAFDDYQPVWCRFTEDDCIELPITLNCSSSRESYCCFCDEYLLTRYEEAITPPQWLNCIPTRYASEVSKWLSLKTAQVHLKFWNLNTGLLHHQFATALAIPDATTLTALPTQNQITSSRDGKLLAVADGARIELWEVEFRRSYLCWSTCNGVVILACWIAWPGKAKMT